MPDFRTRYFEYPTLQKIHGRPNIDSIITLHRQVKRNAQRVPSTLGGGQYGYLGLVLPAETYNTIPHTTPFTRPTDPGEFQPRTATGAVTRAAIATLTSAKAHRRRTTPAPATQ